MERRRLAQASSFGHGLSMEERGEGQNYTQKFDSSQVTIINGKTKTEKSSVKLSLAVKYPTDEVVFIQMDEENQVTYSKTCLIIQIPEKIVPEETTAYIIVEEHKTDENGESVITRTVYGTENETIGIYTARDDGICDKTSIEVNWKK